VTSKFVTEYRKKYGKVRRTSPRLLHEHAVINERQAVTATWRIGEILEPAQGGDPRRPARSVKLDNLRQPDQNLQSARSRRGNGELWNTVVLHYPASRSSEYKAEDF